MTLEIDALGKACPMPVVLAKQALDQGARDITVLVDNDIAVQNLTRLAESQGLTVRSAAESGRFSVRISGEGVAPSPAAAVKCSIGPGAPTFFISRSFIGDGSPELGRNLMKMFLYTLAEGSIPPRALIFMNGGVQLPAGEDEQIVAHLKALESKGCTILVCGTCLNFFGLAEHLKVGVISNMYDIVEQMQHTERVITV